MPHIEYLAGLGHGAKQRIVAALAFLLAVKAHGRAFGETPGGQHRAVEVERHAGKAKNAQLLEHSLPTEPAQQGNAAGILARQGPTDSGHIRQALNAQQAVHHGIVMVVAHILKPAIAQQEVGNQQQHDKAEAKDRADGEVPEAPAQLLLQTNAVEQLLVCWIALMVHSSNVTTACSRACK